MHIFLLAGVGIPNENNSATEAKSSSTPLLKFLNPSLLFVIKIIFKNLINILIPKELYYRTDLLTLKHIINFPYTNDL